MLSGVVNALQRSNAPLSRRRRALAVLVASLSALGLLEMTAPAASGAVIAAEDFQSYTAGNPLGGTGGTGFTGSWVVGTAPTVVAPGTPLSYTVKNVNNVTTGTIAGGTQAAQFTNATANNSTTGTTASHDFATPNSGDTVWARFLVRFDTGSVENSDFTTLYFGAPTSATSVNNPNFA